MMHCVYIAGPMKGIPLFNFPEFDKAEQWLRAHGHDVVNPAQIDRDHGFDPSTLHAEWDWNVIPESAGSLEGIVERDIQWLINHCTAIYMLDGWEHSKGARAELAVAEWLHYEVMYQTPPKQSSEWKDTNPKDAVGCTKPPLHCIPTPVLYEIGMGMYEGGWKYREANWRVIGVRASVYYDAALRHLTAWWDGEDIDPQSQIHHISKVMSCLAVLRDCQMQSEHGASIDYKDDRPPRSAVPMTVYEQQFRSMLDRLQREYGERKPPYTQAGGTVSP